MNLQQLVVDSARRTPNALAVHGPDGEVTYRELDREADRFAATLSEQGVRRGDRVVIWTDKCTRAVAAMQGTLRLGAVYVPVDGANPARRTAAIVRNCSPAAILTTAERFRELAGQATAPAVLVDANDLEPPEQAPPVAVPVDEDDPAYILYTSGSTGEPKGVCISHRNALAFVTWAVGELGITAEDRLSNHASFGFDLSVLDIYGAFLAGASTHLIPVEMAYAPTLLVDFLRRQRISIWYSVPSVLILMIQEGGLLEADPPSVLRAVLFAGEPLPIGYVAQLRRWTGARLLNLYGPTETNVCTYHEVREEDLARDRPVPIGIPCSGDRVWARTEDGREAGPGEEGELMVAGPTVMLGYWGHEPNHGPYATGDVVRVLDAGALDYVGRRDHMVKLRGHRAELGEIEAALERHPRVAQAAAVVTGSGMGARLEAFVVPADGQPPSLLALKRHCVEHLPQPMNVDGVHPLDALPLTANGKVDRRTLYELATRQAEQRAG